MVNFIRDLFHNMFPHERPEKLPSAATIEAIALPDDKLRSMDGQQGGNVNPPQLLVGTAQSIGLQRDHNEDTLYLMHSILADGNNDLPFGIFIVADGMGGHLNGEVASGCAARTLGSYLLQNYYQPFLTGQSDSEGASVLEVLERGINEAHRSVLKNAPGGGTTLTAALVVGNRVTLSHVGDTRAYLIFPDGRMQVITQDHTLVKRLQDLGQIDEREAFVHPQRNVLYRALGQSEPFRPDMNTYTLPDKGYMMLCSDGLWGSVTDDEMSRIIEFSSHPAMICQKLVEAANVAGGPDNISVILVQYIG